MTLRASSKRLRASAGLVFVTVIGLGYFVGLEAIPPASSVLLAIALAMSVTYAGVLASARPRAQDRSFASEEDDGSCTETVSILVPARNEASVIRNLIGDLAAQDYREPNGHPLFEVIVIDDGSSDDTGSLALSEAVDTNLGDVVRVVRNDPRARRGGSGKGAALASVATSDCTGDIICVLDADARVQPDFLRRVIRSFTLGASAVTCPRRVIISGPASRLARQLIAAQADEFDVDACIQTARFLRGGSSEFRGNGMFLRRNTLTLLGGWPAAAQCEDLELSTRAAASGVVVEWANTPVWEEPVLTLSALWRQRLRWSTGAIERDLGLAREVVRSRNIRTAAKADFFAYAATCAVPLFQIGVLAGAASSLQPVTPMLCAAAYIAAGSTLVGTALTRSARANKSSSGALMTAGRAARLMSFSLLWLPLSLYAWIRFIAHPGDLAWNKTTHRGSDIEWSRPSCYAHRR